MGMRLVRTASSSASPGSRPLTRIADDQGFFHWELEFAQAFANGGFDLQVGNPPWVRPRWDDDAVLAEHDPGSSWRRSRRGRRRNGAGRAAASGTGRALYCLRELTTSSPRSRSSARRRYTRYSPAPSPTSTVPSCARSGPTRSAAGPLDLLHPDTHFTGDKEGRLREAAYRRLRIHGDFVNAGQRFFPEPVGHTAHFGVHVYGRLERSRFDHLSWLVSTDALLTLARP